MKTTAIHLKTRTSTRGMVGRRLVRYSWATETWHYLDTGEQITKWRLVVD